MSMHEVRILISQYGDWFYLITFLWTVLEGETFVILAGFAAQKGLLNVWALFMAAWVGSFCGDQIFFFTGRRFGIRILNHLPKLKAPIDKSLGWLERHAEIFIVAYRFMYGIRNISGFAIGMSHLPWKKFMIWNAFAAFVWAASFIGFGYLFGDVISHWHSNGQKVEDNVRQVMMAMLALFLIIVSFRLFVMWLQKRKKK